MLVVGRWSVVVLVCVVVSAVVSCYIGRWSVIVSVCVVVAVVVSCYVG